MSAKKRTGKTRESASKKKDPLKWWREARFGMFIHWGLYAVPAGRWKGKEIAGIGEWIMKRAEIPVAEYEPLAEKFNPVKFDADRVVRLARDAGMKYLVITAKHHDGFAMYDSPSSDYDIVDRTPYGKDPMKALAKACRKHGVRLCFYYSQDQDWHHPDARGNDWDYDDAKKDFARYLREKVKPQLRELLTQYGPIGLIWFDTPGWITKRQSLDLKRFVHELQPNCLVSGRVGHEVGDYGSLGDNQIPVGRLEGDWETPATMNDTWGFKVDDRRWKSVDDLLLLLVDLASKGINYLLNIGPRADGSVPKASIERLEEIGRWMKVNGEAVYGTQASPWPYEFDWGRVTRKGRRLYLHFMKWPTGRFRLRGLRTPVRRAWLLADPKTPVSVARERDEALGIDTLELALPRRKPDKRVSVVCLELAGEPEVDDSLVQQPDGTVTLPAFMGEVSGRAKTGVPTPHRSGAVTNWTSKSAKLSWRFTVDAPGRFEVRLVTKQVHWPRVWKGGHKVSVTVGGKTLTKKVKADETLDTPRAAHEPEAATIMGRVEIGKAGGCEVVVRAEEINKELRGGLTVAAVELRPLG